MDVVEQFYTAFAAPVEDGESRVLCSMIGIILVKKVTNVILMDEEDNIQSLDSGWGSG